MVMMKTETAWEERKASEETGGEEAEAALGREERGRRGAGGKEVLGGCSPSGLIPVPQEWEQRDPQHPSAHTLWPKTFHHFLRWDEPDPLDAAQHQRLLYDVQYRRYGNSSHWKPVPRCVGIALPSCDLSAETQQPRQRYYARVRVLVGSQGASKWVQAPPFRPEEATLWLSGVSLTTHNGLIHVSIQLPISPWGNVTYEDLHPWGRQFYVYVRMMFNGAQVNLVQVQNSTEFDLQGLRPGKEYCVSVEPRLNSFPTPGIRTEEQCLFLLPLKEGEAQLLPLQTNSDTSVIGRGPALSPTPFPSEAGGIERKGLLHGHPPTHTPLELPS
nr:PREDICTED: interleukin-10 receptor subunit alpha [Anolis carolinensis]|eukprot:XP_008121081.1 PREDICTED: interleukin-10 receptor subunit alpha [Anolis carolinensis]